MQALRWLGRAVGWLLVLAALAMAGRDAFAWLDTGVWNSKLLGELWREIHSESLLLIQPAVERYISPVLWNDVIFPVLLAPAWLVFAVPGIVLLLLSSLRRRGRGTFRSR